jgi:hypothetical protein
VSSLLDSLGSLIQGKIGAESANMGFPIPNLTTNQNVKSGAGGENAGISGGTAFNVGGINLGTQGPSASNAESDGGLHSPVASIASIAGNGLVLPILLVGAGLAVWLLLRK